MFTLSLVMSTFLFLLFLLPSADSISFQVTRFDPDRTDMIYEGDAEPSVGAVEFNSLTYQYQVGQVRYAERVPLWNPKTREQADFTTRFSFVVTQTTSLHAAGLAFFLAPVGFGIPPNSGGGFLGLFNTTTSDSSQNQIVLVEFDTFPNPEWDPEVEHVGINVNSISSAKYNFWNSSLHNGDTAEAVITYNATTRNLSVSWTYSNTSNSLENSSLSHQIDLMDILPEWVTIGFSAATSGFIERHQLLTWEFNSSLVVKETNGKDEKRTRLIIILVVSLGVLTAGVLIVLGILWRQRQKRMRRKATENHVNLTSINDDLERGAGPRKFSYHNLASATSNFSNERKLGEGGFGAVYKGYLHGTGTAVAVKRIAKGSRQGKKEYITEVKIISQLRHRNLVQLFGWCHDKGEFLLVYEFMLNGSLDSHLFGKKIPLNWALRYKIALGLASALLYLHEEWEQCVVHRDIKSSNVMLDSNFNVKLGDFGLARLMDHEIGPQTASGLAGTLGYMAPEYIRTGRASKESDVYSFGVVLLEIATGRKSSDPMERSSQMGMVEWVWDLYGSGNPLLAIDERLDKVFDVEQVKCLMIVGLWCAHPDCNIRPSIRQAMQVLHFEAAMPNLPSKMPVPVYYVPTPSVSSGQSLITNSSISVGR
ncbi:hypothetical protein ACOSP7_023453 [Xanthoceras sorbifolium]